MMDTFLSFFRRGFVFECPKSDVDDSSNVHVRGNVILIHGLLMRAPAMRTVCARFFQARFHCFCYDYPTSRLGIFRHGEILREKLRELISTLPPDEKLFFVTHSLGGILLRIAIADFSAEELARIHSIVMLSPPNQGSYWPERIQRFFPLAWFFNRCLGDLRATEDSPLRKIPLPAHGAFPRLLIVGGSRDKKVAPVFLPLIGVPAEIVFVDCGHAQLRHSRAAFEFARRFFEGKSPRA